MSPRIKSSTLLALGTICLLMLTGCETTAPSTDEGAYTTSEEAETYEDQAQNLPSPEREQLLITAAETYWEEDRESKAQSILASINQHALPDSLLTRHSLLSAEIALANEHYFEAKNLLSEERLEKIIPGQPAALRLRWYLISGELYSLVGDEGRSIYNYTRAVPLLKGDDKIRGVHNKIWQLISHFSEDELSSRQIQSSDTTLAGWYQLAQAVRSSQGDIATQVDSILAWQSANASHPAAVILPSSLEKAIDVSKNLPQQVAVLLPHTTEYKLASETIRDGILAAYYQVLSKDGRVPAIKFYNSDRGDIVNLYQQATAEGADLILGPLRKEHLASLMSAPPLPVPVLGLSYLEDGTNRQEALYQFGLSIRDEAFQVAERAWISGYRRVLAITPDTGWGDKALEAFRQAWQEKGGTFVGTVSYGSNINDYRPLLEPIFLVKHSQERAARLQRTLGKSVDYTPTRRSDVDMIFLIAYPQDGRQIKPTLDFLYAGDLPILATSHIYDDTSSPALDRDLDGILFTAMPWNIKGLASGRVRLEKDLPSAYRNLFALGVDAYRLHQWLPLLKATPDAEIHGYTGRLSMGPKNLIVRKQPWARFRNGTATPAPSLSGDLKSAR